MSDTKVKPKAAESQPPQPRELLKLDCDRQLMVARFSSCGRMLIAGGYDASIRRWDLGGEKPVEVDRVAGHRGWVSWLEVQPAGELVFSVDTWGRLQATRGIAGKPELAWHHDEAHDGWIRSLSVSDDGQVVVTAGRDGAVRVWSAADGKLLHEVKDHPGEVYAVAIHPDKTNLVTGDLFGVLRRFELPGGKQVGESIVEKMHYYERIQDVGGLRLLRFHDKGRTLICAGGEPLKTGRAISIPTIHWLDWPDLKIKHTARLGAQNHGFVFDLAWHPDGFWAVVTSGQPGSGQFLLLKPGQEKPFFNSTKMSNCHSLAVHGDGRIVVTASNRNSQGNGAVRDKMGKYVANYSPLHLFSAPGAEEKPKAG